MSFFEELKRRNVFRVAIGYIITAWLLLQVVDLVLENVNAPDWVMQVFMLALAIGFPLAVFFAWAFEMTPEGVKLEKDVDRSQSITNKTAHKMNRNIMIAMAIAVVFLLVDRFRPDTEQESDSPQESVSIPQDTLEPTNEPIDENSIAATTEKSIAVLPFVDMSPESDQAYFADGISEEILNVLVKTGSLKVAGRTSSFQFRDTKGDLKSIGEQLGVNHILEGSIRKANNRVRITAQLVTASDGFHLWSETYDRDLTDIFAIQDEIARAIADALAIELDLGGSGQELVKVTTSNMDAYDRYLEGRGLIARRQDFSRAIDLLNEAVEIDPNFAAGWAANAQAHALSIYYISGVHTDAMKLAESMANKALEIDPNLSMAHSALGDIYRDSYQWMKAKDSYLRALTLNPENVEANEQYAQMLWRANYFEEALKYSSKAVELDELSKLNLIVNAGLLYANGDHAGGWAEINRGLEMVDYQGNSDFLLQQAIILALSEGLLEKAIELTKDFAKFQVVEAYDPGITEHYLQLVQVLNSREDTLAFLAPGQYEITLPVSTFYWAIDMFWAAYYGDYDLAAKIMEAGALYDERVSSMDMSFINFPLLSPVHNSEAYKRLVKKTGLDDFWRENGYPDYCKPVGEDDFVCK